MIDTPRAGGDTGGVVAGPIFQRIAEQGLRHLGVAPTINPAPAVIVPRRAAAPPSQPRPIVVSTTVPVTGLTVLPDLRGYGVREAVHELARLGLTPRVSGVGIVVDQRPLPGSPLEPGTLCTLVLERDPQAALVPGVPPL